MEKFHGVIVKIYLVSSITLIPKVNSFLYGHVVEYTDAEEVYNKVKYELDRNIQGTYLRDFKDGNTLRLCIKDTRRNEKEIITIFNKAFPNEKRSFESKPKGE